LAPADVPAAGATHVWDRAAGVAQPERMPHAGLLAWLYGSRSGAVIRRLITRGAAFSKLATWWSHRPRSSRKIDDFVRAYEVAMEDYVDGPFATFNDFFIRRFRDGARTFPDDSGRLPAGAEGVCLGWECITGDESFPVKGQFLRPDALLGGSERARSFEAALCC